MKRVISKLEEWKWNDTFSFLSAANDALLLAFSNIWDDRKARLFFSLSVGNQELVSTLKREWLFVPASNPKL